jgi:hypothetical protein
MRRSLVSLRKNNKLLRNLNKLKGLHRRSCNLKKEVKVVAEDRLKEQLERKTQEVQRLKNLNKKISQRKSKKQEKSSTSDDLFLSFFSFLKFG